MRRLSVLLTAIGRRLGAVLPGVILREKEHVHKVEGAVDQTSTTNSQGSMTENT